MECLKGKDNFNSVFLQVNICISNATLAQGCYLAPTPLPSLVFNTKEGIVPVLDLGKLKAALSTMATVKPSRIMEYLQSNNDFTSAILQVCLI